MSSSSRDVTVTSVLTLTLDATVAVGTYPIVVHGNAEGQEEKTVDISFVVAAASGVRGSHALGPAPAAGSLALASRGGQGTR